MEIDNLIEFLTVIRRNKTLIDSLIKNLPNVSIGNGHITHVEIQGDKVIIHAKTKNDMNVIVTFAL